jgi:hypothetical protein
VGVTRRGGHRARVVAVADQIQEIVIEALWGQGRSTTWPECPSHPGSHPLQAASQSGAPTWVCPASGRGWSAIGALDASEDVTSVHQRTWLHTAAAGGIAAYLAWSAITPLGLPAAARWAGAGLLSLGAALLALPLQLTLTADGRIVEREGWRVREVHLDRVTVGTDGPSYSVALLQRGSRPVYISCASRRTRRLRHAVGQQLLRGGRTPGRDANRWAWRHLGVEIAVHDEPPDQRA